jgi:hypothetical protein
VSRQQSFASESGGRDEGRSDTLRTSKRRVALEVQGGGLAAAAAQPYARFRFRSALAELSEGSWEGTSSSSESSITSRAEADAMCGLEVFIHSLCLFIARGMLLIYLRLRA